MKQRVSKADAERLLKKSRATIDRMISRGELETELEPHGSRHRVWVLLDNPEVSDEPLPEVLREASHKVSTETSHENSKIAEDATQRERMKGLEELVSYYKQQLNDSEWRYQQLLGNLSSSQRTVEAFARALPEPQAAATQGAQEEAGQGKQVRRWWPFR